MHPGFPKLTILPLENLLLHEQHDDQRTPPLVERIRSSGVFRHPPIATPIQDGTDRYVVLDGANRTSALRILNCPHILAQIVEPDSPGLHLRTWNHVLLDIEPALLLQKLHAIPGLDLVSSEEKTIQLPRKGEIGVALIQFTDGTAYALSASAIGLEQRIASLNAVVNKYKHAARLDRTTFSDIQHIHPLYPDLSALVIFPKFNIQDLLQLVGAGHLMPTGITRTTIAPRALHVNIPLEYLMSAESTAEKNLRLQKLIHKRESCGNIHYYAEAIFLFDE